MTTKSRTRRRRGGPPVAPPSPSRSAVMRAVHSSGTAPELYVRSLVRRLGFRASFNSAELPGKPDLVLRKTRKAIFVHGCFWHGHTCARGDRRPKTNANYWRSKISRNKTRDAANITRLRGDGWRVLVVWECETTARDALTAKLRRFFSEAARASTPRKQGPRLPRSTSQRSDPWSEHPPFFCGSE